MQNYKILELINQERINELKDILQDEIYEDSLKKKPNANKRYTAMKKYFSYTNLARECLQKPCLVNFDGVQYTSFTNSYSLVLTTEPTGEIELFDESTKTYPDIKRLIRFEGYPEKLDINAVLAAAKSKGYKRKVAEVNNSFRYLMSYDGSYYKLGLVDISYGIIATDDEVEAYHKSGERSTLTIKNDLGICLLMPVVVEHPEDYIIIEA